MFLDLNLLEFRDHGQIHLQVPDALREFFTAPAAFVEAVGEAVVAQGDHAKGPAFVLPQVNLDALWVRDLVRRRRRQRRRDARR